MKPLVRKGTTIIAMMGLTLLGAQAQRVELSGSTPSPITTAIAISSNYWQSVGTTHDINSGGTLSFGDTRYETIIQMREIGTSTININTGGTMTFSGAGPYGGILYIGNRNLDAVGLTTIGILNLEGGSLDGANLTEIVLGREGSLGTLNMNAGTAVLGVAPVFGTIRSGNMGVGSINFTTNSTGTLTITGADQAYYEGIYSDGNLTRGGTTYGTFAENFTVAGSDLTSIAGTIPPNLPPYWKIDPIAGNAGLTDRAYTDTLAGKAADHNGDAITYSRATAGPPWLNVASDGTLSGMPDVLGTNTFTVTATDIDGSANATLNIFISDPTAPVWSEDPITGTDAIADSAYIGSLAGKATEPDGDTITYSKTGATSWLTVASDGTLGGTPSSASDVGLNTFTVEATDVNGSTSATLEILVYVPSPPVMVVLADFEGSTARAAFDINPTTSTDWDGTLTSATNLNSGTTGGTWSALSSTTTAGDGLIDVANAAYMADNQLIMGIHPYHNDNPGHLTTATLDFDTAVDLDGLVLSMDAAMLGFGGQPGQTYIDLMSGTSVVARVSASHAFGGGKGSINHYSAIGSYGQYATLLAPELSIWGGSSIDVDVVNIAMTFGATEYGLKTTGAKVADINAFGLTYVNAATTIDSIRFSASFSKAAMAFDNISVALTSAPPTPVDDLTIAGPTNGDNAVTISWTGKNNSSYSVETNANIITGSGWQPFKTGLTGTGGLMSVTNTIGAPNQVFYRVISE